MKGTVIINKVPRRRERVLCFSLSINFERGNCAQDLTTKKIVVAIPAATILPPSRLSVMNIAKIGPSKPKLLRINTSERISNKSFLFMFKLARGNL